jgi:hypothetical protein
MPTYDSPPHETCPSYVTTKDSAFVWKLLPTRHKRPVLNINVGFSEELSEWLKGGFALLSSVMRQAWISSTSDLEVVKNM